MSKLHEGLTTRHRKARAKAKPGGLAVPDPKEKEVDLLNYVVFLRISYIPKPERSEPRGVRGLAPMKDSSGGPLRLPSPASHQDFIIPISRLWPHNRLDRPEGPVSESSYFLGDPPPRPPFSRFARHAVTGRAGSLLRS
jgi:hypothetical protein